MSEPVKLWRHYLPSENGEGWAVVIMDSSGFFSTCSDYGNYAYLWGSHGRTDFRQFVIGLAADPDYCGNKLDHEKWHKFSDRNTVKNIKRKIIERRRDGKLDKETARDHWDYMMEYSHGDITFDEWIRDQELFYDHYEAADCGATEPSADLLCFCTKTIPRLAKILRAELEAEALPGVQSQPQTA